VHYGSETICSVKVPLEVLASSSYSASPEPSPLLFVPGSGSFITPKGIDVPLNDIYLIPDNTDLLEKPICRPHDVVGRIKGYTSRILGAEITALKKDYLRCGREAIMSKA